ncbi:hypothetical protein PMAYCL1PPCAC_16810, partial [Pristionchus mayeri]
LTNIRLPHGEMTNSPIADTADATEKSCLVCGAQSEGANSGVESCRACSAFFRRSFNREFVCKKLSKCELTRGKPQCRACRLKRCLKVGMLPELINTSHRHTPPKHEDPGPSNDAGPSKSDVSSKEDDDFLLSHASRIPLLTNIAVNYHLSRSRRFLAELELLPKTAKQPNIDNPVEAQQLYPCDVLLGDSMWKTNFPFITEFCDNTFEEFATLEKSDQFDLFRSFIATLFIFELEEATAQNKLELENKRQISRTTYVDYSRPDLFWSNRESTANEQFLETWAEACGSYMNNVYFTSFRNLNLSVTERAAIVGLLFWNADFDMLISDQTLALCNEMRARILRELHVYYTDILRMEDYCLRLGKVLDHLHETITHARGMRTEMVMYVMIGAMKPDTTFFDLIRI